MRAAKCCKVTAHCNTEHGWRIAGGSITLVMFTISPDGGGGVVPCHLDNNDNNDPSPQTMASLHPGLMTAVWRPRAPGGPASKYLLGRHLLAGLATLATLARLRAGPRIPAHARHSCECVASPHPASTIYCPLCTPERVNTGAGDC